MAQNTVPHLIPPTVAARKSGGQTRQPSGPARKPSVNAPGRAKPPGPTIPRPRPANRVGPVPFPLRGRQPGVTRASSGAAKEG